MISTSHAISTALVVVVGIVVIITVGIAFVISTSFFVTSVGGSSEIALTGFTIGINVAFGSFLSIYCKFRLIGNGTGCSRLLYIYDRTSNPHYHQPFCFVVCLDTHHSLYEYYANAR